MTYDIKIGTHNFTVEANNAFQAADKVYEKLQEHYDYLYELSEALEGKV